MKKAIGICLILAVVLGAAIWGADLFLSQREEEPEQIEYLDGNHPAAEETEQILPEETTESMSVQEPFLYILRETDGELVVYEQDGTTVWMETGIRTEHMEPVVVRLFQEGVTIRDERELYDLLESYSS